MLEEEEYVCVLIPLFCSQCVSAMSAGSLPQAPLQLGLEHKNALNCGISAATAIFRLEHWSELPQKGSMGALHPCETAKLHCRQNEAGSVHICHGLGARTPAVTPAQPALHNFLSRHHHVKNQILSPFFSFENILFINRIQRSLSRFEILMYFSSDGSSWEGQLPSPCVSLSSSSLLCSRLAPGRLTASSCFGPHGLTLTSQM